MTSAARSAGPGAVEALRQALIGETRDATVSNSRALPAILLTGSVTRLERERLGGNLRLEVEVSLVVMERRGGQMRALLTGRAISTESFPQSNAEARHQERIAITAAVREALDRLWSSMDVN